LSLFGWAHGQLRDVSKSRGIDHTVSSALFIGGGVCWFDYNNDGWDDLYATGGEEGDLLFHNTGKDFKNVSSFSRVRFFTDGRYTTSSIAGDINNDGCDDLFITTMDLGPNILLLNTCDGKFLDVTSEYGLDDDIARSTGATFFDLDQDGDLDLYVVNYVDESRYFYDSMGLVIGFDHTYYQDFLYENIDGTRFEKIEIEAPTGTGLAVTSADYDDDGDQDIMTINDFGGWIIPNKLFENQEGELLDVSESTRFDIGIFGMGIAAGDLNNDLKTDFYITNIGQNHLLVYDKDSAFFTDKTTELNLENTFTPDGEFTTGWGTCFFDLENDGDLDIYVSNGFIPVADFIKNSLYDPNKLYRNDGNDFIDITDEFEVGKTSLNRAAAISDFDQDGDQDLFISTLFHTSDPDASSYLYLNEEANGNFLQFKLQGDDSNFNAFGSKVFVYAGNEAQVRELSSGGSHGSQHSQIIHFGIGEKGRADSVIVKWPSGKKSRHTNLKANKRYYLTENSENVEIMGCMDPDNEFYDAEATVSFNCYENIEGCTDPFALNYDPEAILDNGNCRYEAVLSVQHSDTELVVFPTISNSKVTIKNRVNSKIGTVFVKDMSGSMIYSSTTTTNTLILNIDSWASGMYLLDIIKPDGERFSSVFIKN